MAESHEERVDRLRRAYREAHGRFVLRLQHAEADAAERPTAGGGWSAAQIGWHVAAVTRAFAGVVSGDQPGAQPLPDGFAERQWPEVIAAIPQRLQAGGAVVPPAGVRRDDALSALAESASRLDTALSTLSPDRGAGLCITHPFVGTVTLYQVGEWATAHVIRHNAHAKRVLGF